MSKYKWPIIAIVVLIIGAVYVLWNPPSTKDALNFWRGEYNELRNISTASEQIHLATIAELEQGNAMLQGSIDSANTIIANLEGKQGEANATIGQLNTALGQAKTDAERVPILTALVEEWKGKFTLAQAQIAEKDKVIFSLTDQYRSALQIGEEYRNLWTTEKTLRLKCEDGLSLSDKRIATLGRTVKTTRLFACAVVLAVVLLKR